MSYWVNKFDELAEEQKKAEVPLTVENISIMTLDEFARREIGVEIFSNVLGSKIWLCSNESMAEQIRGDDPDMSCYTVEEIKQLLSLNPSIESLNKIHETKIVFPDSKIKYTTMNQAFDASVESDKGPSTKKTK